MVLNVINRPKGVATKLNAIVKIHKYKRLHEGHHFIMMAKEVHDTCGRDMDHFIKKCACLFHDKQSRGHLSFSFCIQFVRQHVNIALQHVLTLAIERIIGLASDACSRPPIIIKYHDLHACNIKRVVGEITSYHERD
jgi:hypothetical protein